MKHGKLNFYPCTARWLNRMFQTGGCREFLGEVLGGNPSSCRVYRQMRGFEHFIFPLLRTAAGPIRRGVDGRCLQIAGDIRYTDMTGQSLSATRLSRTGFRGSGDLVEVRLKECHEMVKGFSFQDTNYAPKQ